MSINLLEQDRSHRLLALDPSKSFTVSAPAGSGKTELLIQRFLILLHHVKSPQEILAITFTKKAANEMRERIIKALKNAVNGEEPRSPHQQMTWKLAKKVIERDGELQWNLMNNPNQLRIQTIDSLCAYLTQNLPLLSHFGSQPRISDHPSFLYREAVQEILLHIEENFSWTNSIAELFLHLDNDVNKLENLLISLLAKRDQWISYIQLDMNNSAIREQLEHHLQSVISSSLQKVKSLFPQELTSEFLEIFRFAASHAMQANMALSACRDLIQLPGIEFGAKDHWQMIATFLLTKSYSWRKRLDATIGFPALATLKNPEEKKLHLHYRERFNELINSFLHHEELRLNLKELFKLPASHYKNDEWNILQALLQVLKITVAQLRVTFQKHGQIDFIENAQGALFALGTDESPTDLALALDYQIRHILMDEFQDTSFSQYQLLKKLTLGWEDNDGRTLFIVGDPMQSIYRFRCAEVSLFLRLREQGLGHIQFTPLNLAVNFRSTPQIVAWNNALFQHIFPAKNDMTNGAIAYHPSISNTENHHDSCIQIKDFFNCDDVEQANSIASLIGELKQNYPYEKIAILVRGRGHLPNILKALKAAKITYSAIDIDPLAARQYIQDVMSLTKALLHLGDRISWLALLRSPLCGLTLNDLWLLAHEDPHGLIWEKLFCKETFKLLSVDGQKRLQRMIPILQNKLRERDRENLRSWIENTWILLGGPATLPHLNAMEDINSYFNLLHEYNNQIINLDQLSEKIDHLFATTRLDDYLQIMTIHAAKGLEFDSVILPHLERKNAIDDKSLLTWMEQPLSDDNMALLLAPIHAIGEDKNHIYAYIERQQKIKSDYETDRLLYVAMTRASKRLYLFFNTKENANGEIQTESGSFLQKFWPIIAKQNHHPENIQSIYGASISRIEKQPTLTAEKMQLRRPLYRLDTLWENPIRENERITESAHQKQNGFRLNENIHSIVGTIIHSILQRISQFGLEWWEKKEVVIQKNYITRQLMQRGIVNEMDSATLSIEKAIRNTLNDKRGRWILFPHRDAKSEFAISSFIDNKLENLILDRTFVDENNIRWIIDYKTTHFYVNEHAKNPLQLEDALEREKKNYQEKMELYKQAIMRIDHLPIRLGLYFPSHPAWKEWAAKMDS